MSLPDFVVVGMLVMAGFIVGARVQHSTKVTRRLDPGGESLGWHGGSSQHVANPVIGEAMKPLDRLEAAAKTAYDTDKKTRDAQYEAFKARKDSL